jgi:hypothetical protein
MSYTKIAPPSAPLGASHMDALLAQFAVEVDGIGDELLAAGAYVTLDSGQTVWCSCIVHDRPETPQIDFLVVAVEIDADGPRVKQNGQMVALATWRGVMPEHLDAWGVDTVRKACLMIALGEPQPQVPIPLPAEGGPTEQDVFVLPAFDSANGSIRAHISSADQLAAPLADVL